MGRLMDPTFVANTGNSKGGPVLIPLESIPADVQQEVEDIYAGLKAPGAVGRMRIAFDTKAELDLYTQQVISYCAQRESGAIRFRKSPTRNLPENAMDFRISDVTEKDEPVIEIPAAPVTPTVAPVVPTKAVAGRRR